MRYLMMAAMLAAAPAAAQDFSEGSEARGWGLSGEEKARFEALAVDAVCALTGDCPEDCGGGERQMVLIRSVDGEMVIAAKNGQPAFTGATEDLAPYCNQLVEVDGLMVGDPGISGTESRIYMVQTIRVVGEEEWSKANRWTRIWREAHPDASGDPWYRQDERVVERIEAEGFLGLGKEADEAFFEEWF